jgi:hypothetical protein
MRQQAGSVLVFRSLERLPEASQCELSMETSSGCEKKSFPPEKGIWREE